jgi:predicted RNA-binding protein YlqC (UPF0109 family)
MKELALHLVKGLADRPDEVRMEVFEDGDAVTLEFHVAEEDKGKIIGKGGKVIKAVRALVGINAAKTGKSLVLELE